MTGPLPQSMRYIDMAGPGGSEVLTLATGPVPRPGPQEVLIRVTAAGVNRPDVLQRTGSYPPPPGASTRTYKICCSLTVKVTFTSAIPSGPSCTPVTGIGFSSMMPSSVTSVPFPM